MRETSIRTQILSVAVAALLPTLAALVFLADRVNNLGTATRVVNTTRHAIELGTRLLKLSSDMHLAIRAYTLSGDNIFLDTYQSARAPWPETLVEVSAVFAHDPAQTRRLAQIDEDTNNFFRSWEDHLTSRRPPGDDQNAWFRIGEDEVRIRRISATISELVQHEEAQISTQLQDVEQARHQVYVAVAGTSLVAIGLLVALTAILGRSIARPIQRVAEAAHRLGAGHWGERVSPQGGRETRILANAFNHMTAALRQARAALAARNRELEQSSARLAASNERLAERQRETDDFLYVLSHDLRAPLINIQGFGKRLHVGMTALAADVGDPAKHDEVAKQLSRMAESLKFVNLGTAKIDQLIARLLEISRLTTRSSQHQWIATGTLVRDVLGACHFQLEERGIETTIGLLPRVFADPVHLNQVFTNLIDNAIKYMGDRPVKRITITAAVEGDRYRFAVQDTGPGIDPKDRDKVFRMFTRLAPHASPGEGIGLTAVRAIISRHGGRIWVESTVGVGSTFCFTLPQAPDNAPADPAQPPVETGDVGATGEETIDAH